ncbi:MAG: D-Ala-D-Ala carboxypeptidase family metallohydrolase [Hyphomicrobium sp.]|jgi:hypothetical protein
MSKRSFTALLGACAIAILSTSAQARVDHSPISSTYDEDWRGARPSLSKNFRAKQDRHAKRSSERSRQARGTSRSRSTERGAKLKSRAVTAGNDGAGTSRSCLQSEARALLGRIEAQFGPVSIVSTCRPGAVVAGSGKPSKHRYGMAIDFSAGGRKGAIVNWLLQNHHSGGTMTYANMSHIHVDIGPRFVSLNSRQRG